MINLPKVSVVTITYGHQDYIIETIKGVLKQNYTGKIEFIISNDNSPDDTDQVISDFFKSIEIPQNFEINYINHATNIGVMPNFYDALTKASGDYIALCEGDDYWIDPMKLQKQIDFLENNKDYQMVFSRCEELGNKGARKINICYNKEYFDTDIFNQWLIPTASVLFRNNLTIEDYKIFNNPNILFGDFYLFLIQFNNGRVRGFEDSMVVYRIHQNSLTNRTKEIDYYERLLEDLLFKSEIYNQKYKSKFKNHILKQSYKNFRYYLMKLNYKFYYPLKIYLRHK